MRGCFSHQIAAALNAQTQAVWQIDCGRAGTVGRAGGDIAFDAGVHLSPPSDETQVILDARGAIDDFVKNSAANIAECCKEF